jgi:hypothetical protein
MPFIGYIQHDTSPHDCIDYYKLIYFPVLLYMIPLLRILLLGIDKTGYEFYFLKKSFTLTNDSGILQTYF